MKERPLFGWRRGFRRGDAGKAGAQPLACARAILVRKGDPEAAGQAPVSAEHRGPLAADLTLRLRSPGSRTGTLAGDHCEFHI